MRSWNELETLLTGLIDSSYVLITIRMTLHKRFMINLIKRFICWVVFRLCQRNVHLSRYWNFVRYGQFVCGFTTQGIDLKIELKSFHNKLCLILLLKWTKQHDQILKTLVHNLMPIYMYKTSSIENDEYFEILVDSSLSSLLLSLMEAVWINQTVSEVHLTRLIGQFLKISLQFSTTSLMLSFS